MIRAEADGCERGEKRRAAHHLAGRRQAEAEAEAEAEAKAAVRAVQKELTATDAAVEWEAEGSRTSTQRDVEEAGESLRTERWRRVEEEVEKGRTATKTRSLTGCRSCVVCLNMTAGWCSRSEP